MTLALWTSLVTILGVWLVTVVSPGPNFLATAYTATAQSRRLGLLVCLGIAVGTTIWATASLLGLGLLFRSTAWLYQVVKLAGGLYLIYLGARLLISAGWRGRGPAVAVAPRLPALSPARAFRRGLIVDLGNPKAAVFFTSLFAVTVPPDAPLWFQALIVVAVVAMAGGWYALVACLVSLRPVAAAFERAKRAVACVTGAAFVALGARLAADR